MFIHDLSSEKNDLILLPRKSLDFTLSIVGNCLCRRRRRCRRHPIQFHRLIRQYGVRKTAAASDRPTDRPRPRGQEEAGATNNNSFELKTNSALGGHEGWQAPRRPRRQFRPDFRGCILIPHPIQVPNLVITSVEGCYLIFLRLRSPDPPLSNEAELVDCSALGSGCEATQNVEVICLTPASPKNLLINYLFV